MRWKRKASRKQVGLRHGFRSGLEEANAEHLKAHKVPVIFEQVKLKYIIPESLRTYTPDFLLEHNGIIVETKGRFLAVDRAKHLFVKLAHPDLDIRFVFSNPNAPISKGSKTTYAMWCESHGFKWAKKLIPVEWINEEPRDGRHLPKLAPGTTLAVPAEAKDLFANHPRQPSRARRVVAAR
jgi:hypothetical protein